MEVFYVYFDFRKSIEQWREQRAQKMAARLQLHSTKPRTISSNVLGYVNYRQPMTLQPGFRQQHGEGRANVFSFSFVFYLILKSMGRIVFINHFELEFFKKNCHLFKFTVTIRYPNFFLLTVS